MQVYEFGYDKVFINKQHNNNFKDNLNFIKQFSDCYPTILRDEFIDYLNNNDQMYIEFPHDIRIFKDDIVYIRVSEKLIKIFLVNGTDYCFNLDKIFIKTFKDLNKK